MSSTIKIHFKYENRKHTLTAILNDDLTLSKSRKNQATDVIENFGDDSRWSIVFDIDNGILYEAIMLRDINGDKSMKVDHVIIWGGEDRSTLLDSATATYSVNIK